MSKQVRIEVLIDLTDDVSREQAADIGENVLIGLRRQAIETAEGLVGDNFEGYTNGIEVDTHDPNENHPSPCLAQTWDVNSNEIKTF